ncbi:MAG TPA: UbiA-like polyprenyltransferase [Bacteroidales bacterium]|nr:UbiA-like polyprenyltransferase [Bacteroidales bacterium]HRR94265.1 UbiA-like polyprenyltransferase [Bacteroidales bacterium]HRT89603.1 UbiA-like polyprenyltransferase [Bacteroidales bacterium]
MSRLTATLRNYLSFIKFSHTVFALPFAVTGYFLAVSRPGYGFSLRILILVILCMVFARNAAMAFNRYADISFDAANPRTASRELPSGKISKRSALLFVIANSVFFVISAGLINNLTLALSPVALLIILGYSFTKRFTVLCHFILGLGLSLAPSGAYIAVTGHFSALPVIYSFIVLTWVSGFDIIYAIQDDSFDREANLFSLPSKRGRKKSLIISAAAHTLTVILVVAAGVAGKGGILYWTGALIFTAMLVYQHIIVTPSDTSRINLAFATVNGVASIIYSVFVIADLLS